MSPPEPADESPSANGMEQPWADTAWQSYPALSRARAAIELGCLIFLVELIMWVVPWLPHMETAYAVLALMIAILLAVCHVRGGLTARSVGIRSDNLGAALIDLAPALLLFVSTMVAVGLAAGALRLGARFFSMLAVVPGWALLQQYMLLAFARPRIQALLGKGSASIAATAGLFGLLHLPNPALTLACLAGGFVWAREYERHPNLIANALTHAVASAFLANSLPHYLLRNMVVGYNHFFR
jgi:hypothetical protein